MRKCRLPRIFDRTVHRRKSRPADADADAAASAQSRESPDKMISAFTKCRHAKRSSTGGGKCRETCAGCHFFRGGPSAWFVLEIERACHRQVDSLVLILDKC